MHRYTMTSMALVLVFTWNCLSNVKADIPGICRILDNPGDLNEHSSVKLRRVRALCDIVQSSRNIVEHEDIDSMPNFDFNQIDSGYFRSMEVFIQTRIFFPLFRK